MFMATMYICCFPSQLKHILLSSTKWTPTTFYHISTWGCTSRTRTLHHSLQALCILCGGRGMEAWTIHKVSGWLLEVWRLSTAIVPVLWYHSLLNKLYWLPPSSVFPRKVRHCWESSPLESNFIDKEAARGWRDTIFKLWTKYATYVNIIAIYISLERLSKSLKK